MKVHYYSLADIIGMAVFAIAFISYLKYNKKTEIYLRNAFIFIFSCVVSSLFMKIEVVGDLFKIVVSYIVVKRTRAYALYVYLLYSAAFIWFYINIDYISNVIFKKKYQISKIIVIAITVIFLLAGLFIYNTDNDQYNHDYVMRNNNVFTYINKNIPAGSVFCSYGYPAVEIPSQTPNYIIAGYLTHSPPIGKKVIPREADMFHLLSIDIPLEEYFRIAEKYYCDYIMLEKNKEVYFTKYSRKKERGFSLINTNRKLSLLPEIFSVLFEDDKYILYNINKKNDLDKLQEATRKAINIFVDKNDFKRAYELSRKLLLIKRSTENYSINEFLRNKIKNIFSESAMLSYSNGFYNINSNAEFLSFPEKPEILLDKESYPELVNQIFISAADPISDYVQGQYIEFDFNTVRIIQEIKLDWYSKDFRAIDFRIDYFINGRYINLAAVELNEDGFYHIKNTNPVKMEKLKISVIKSRHNRLSMRSLMIR